MGVVAPLPTVGHGVIVGWTGDVRLSGAHVTPGGRTAEHSCPRTRVTFDGGRHRRGSDARRTITTSNASGGLRANSYGSGGPTSTLRCIPLLGLRWTGRAPSPCREPA